MCSLNVLQTLALKLSYTLKKQHALIIIALFSLTISACGGGGSSDSPSNGNGEVINEPDTGTTPDPDTSTPPENPETPEIELGSRAEWLSGSWGVAWLPEYFENGGIEGASIQPFLDQIADFKTLQFVQVKLNDGYVFSPVHSAPHKLLESFWYDDDSDRDANGEPLQNLVVPRWGDLTADEPESDPLKEWLVSIKAMGLKTQIYMNTGNMVRDSIPDGFPNVQARWMNWCDTNSEAQAFLNGEAYRTAAYDVATQAYTDTSFTERGYMFCYLEFVLKEYAVRYGDLIDAWVFDNPGMISGKGDDPVNGLLQDQRIYQAFAEAVHAGNPYAALAFNNSPNREEGDTNPYTPATLFDDYMFGHPYGGNNDHASKTNGLYETNYRFIQWNIDTNGKVHANDPNYDQQAERLWDDKVVGHYYPKMAIQSWNGGTQAYENDDFNQWNREMTQAGGALVWGIPLVRSDCSNPYGAFLTAQPWALDQLTQLDQHLTSEQFPGAPNWARADTLLPAAVIGQSYYHVLVEGKDFWDPEGDAITALTLVDNNGDDSTPQWLTITKDQETAGQWILSGTPDETAAINYEITLRIEDSSAERDRNVVLQVNSADSDINFVDLGNGSPVWASNTITLPNANKFERYQQTLIQGRDFSDFQGDDLTLSLQNAPDWLELEQKTSGWWLLSGTPATQDAGMDTFTILLSDGANTSTVNITLTTGDAKYLSLINNTILQAEWTRLTPSSANGEWTFDNHHKNNDRRAVLYSEQAFQSDNGFRLTVDYTTGSIAKSGLHNFSFGLVSTDTDLENYAGFNPFQEETNVYSLGVNLTVGSGDYRGLNFTDSSSLTILDKAGTNKQFVVGSSSQVIIQIQPNGAWQYSIDGVTEASGVIATGFDLTKSYRVVFYGQDDNGGGKSLQKVAIDLL